MIRRVLPLPICVSALFLVALADRAWSDETTDASDGAGPGFRLNFEGHYGPATAAAQQIRAEAAYLRAYAAMQKDLAEARILQAVARRIEGRNGVQAVRDHIEKTKLKEVELARVTGERLTKRRQVNRRTRERLLNHPELTSGEIITGVALNFLKNRLSPTFVSFRASSMGSQAAAQEVASKLHVTRDIVHALQVRQSLARGESHVFRLDEGRALQVDWWPPALRAAEFRSLREKFKQARDAAYEPRAPTATEDEQLEAIGKLIVAHAALEDAFLKRQSRTVRVKSINSFTDYQEARVFLKSLGNEIRRVDRLGPGGRSAESLAFQGTEVPDLLSHMVRNGLEFAAAKPGDEPAYNQVFKMLMDLYEAVEADADVPEAPTDAVIPEPRRIPLGEPGK